MRQFITCSAESYILVWDLKRPPADVVQRQPTIDQSSDDDVFEDPEDDEKDKEGEPKTKGWARLKSNKLQLSTFAFSKDKKWTPAHGKYDFFKIY